MRACLRGAPVSTADELKHRIGRTQFPRRLRGEAEARGLDPNEWFGNVEIVVAERVGAEPVTYVRNIYKYSVAYALVQERSASREQARDRKRRMPGGR